MGLTYRARPTPSAYSQDQRCQVHTRENRNIIKEIQESVTSEPQSSKWGESKEGGIPPLIGGVWGASPQKFVDLRQHLVASEGVLSEISHFEESLEMVILHL